MPSRLIETWLGQDFSWDFSRQSRQALMLSRLRFLNWDFFSWDLAGSRFYPRFFLTVEASAYAVSVEILKLRLFQLRLGWVKILVETVNNSSTVETNLKILSRLRVSIETKSRQIETPKLKLLSMIFYNDFSIILQLF